MHLPPFITDLAIILIVAGMVTLLFRRIGQPVVLGYILAGLLVGPEISFLPTVHEKESIKIWAEIGVIILLFGLGLEVNFKKLASVGVGATITAVIEVLAMLGIGYGIGSVFGWSNMDGLFLGGMLAISSTTIIIKAMEELGLKQKKFVNLVFGVLIVEDLFAILILVLLSTLAASNNLQGSALLFSTAKLAFFLTLWFVGGIFFIPWLLRRVRPILNQETCLIVSLALCLLMVILATQSGFSPALGAFVMGSILAETPEGGQIETTLKPVKDLFAAIFFVSVGMLIDLDMFRVHWFPILVITIVTILGKSISASFGAILSGQNLKNSLQTGMSLAQIGEFSFIIATLGLSLKVTSDFLYPVVVAVSVFTTFTTPYLIRYSEPTYQWIERKLPETWRERIERSFTDIPNFNPLKHFQISFVKIFLNSVIIIAIALACSRYLSTYLTPYLSLLVAIILSLPFLWAIVLQSDKPKYKLLGLEELKQLTLRASISLIGRVLLGIFLLSIVIQQFTSAIISFVIAALLATILGLLGFKNFARIYASLEARFLRHLNENEKAFLQQQQKTISFASSQAHLTELEVHPNSSTVGKTISEMAIRKKFGITLISIKRGELQIVAPTPSTMLMPYDKVSVVGPDENIIAFYQLLQVDPILKEDFRNDKISSSTVISPHSLVIDEESPFLNKTILSCSKHLGLVVSVEKSDGRILGADPNLQLELNDRLWLAK